MSEGVRKKGPFLAPWIGSIREISKGGTKQHAEDEGHSQGQRYRGVSTRL